MLSLRPQQLKRTAQAEKTIQLKFLQIQQLTFEQAKEIFDHGIVQTVAFAAHALSDAFFAKHPLVLFVLVLPALVGMKD